MKTTTETLSDGITLTWLTDDRYIARCLALYGEFSVEELDLFATFVRPGDLVLDVGANIGCHTVALARMVGERGCVIAVEPQRQLFGLLQENVVKNTLAERCRLLPIALGSRAGRALMPPVDYERPGNYGSMSIAHPPCEPQADWPSVEVATIDHVLRDFRVASFWKIDVEGMERGVMRGGQERIMRERPVLYFENDRKVESRKTLEFVLKDLRYRCWWHFPRLVRPERLKLGAARDLELENIRSMNVLALPAEQDVIPNNIPSYYEITDSSSWWEDFFS